MFTGGAMWISGHSEGLFPVLAFWMIPWVYIPSKIVVVLVGDPAAGWAAAGGGGA
jgi:hypothetical protein